MGIIMKKFLLTLLVFFGFNQGNVIADNASNTNAFSFSFESIEGGDLNLNQYVVLQGNMKVFKHYGKIIKIKV